MAVSRFRKFLYDLPGIGKWIRQFYYERRMEKEVAVNSRISQDEIIRRLSEKYLKYIGRPLNIQEPRAFSEKIQWRKLFEHDERFARLSDKYQVREWVAQTVGEQYLIPLLGVWDRFDQIDFRQLPRSFVLKATNSSATNVFVADSRKWNKRLAKRKFDFWMRHPFPYMGNFEMHYLNIKPRIIAEQYMHDASRDGALWDYKFLCFHGEPKYVWVDLERRKGHRRNVYNMNWEKMPWVVHFDPPDYEIPRPETLEEMIRVARALSSRFDHVRVDLYNIQGKVYFGEMTFTSGDGHIKITPDEVDFMLGDLW